MSDIAGQLMAAMDPLMRADAGVIAAFPGRVALYNLAPIAAAAAPFPYAVLGLAHVVGLGSRSGGSAYWDIHVWSRPDPRSTLEAGAIAGAVVRFLQRLDPSAVQLDGLALSTIRWIDTQLLEDPDGMSIHAVVRFEISFDPA